LTAGVAVCIIIIKFHVTMYYQL